MAEKSIRRLSMYGLIMPVLLSFGGAVRCPSVVPRSLSYWQRAHHWSAPARDGRLFSIAKPLDLSPVRTKSWRASVQNRPVSACLMIRSPFLRSFANRFLHEAKPPRPVVAWRTFEFVQLDHHVGPKEMASRVRPEEPPRLYLFTYMEPNLFANCRCPKRKSTRSGAREC